MDKRVRRTTAPKSSAGEFSVGEDALYITTRKGKKITVPVKILRGCVEAKVRRNTVGLGFGIRFVQIYRVRSERGGELTIASSELRPGTVLDRILDAIDSSDAA